MNASNYALVGTDKTRKSLFYGSYSSGAVSKSGHRGRAHGNSHTCPIGAEDIQRSRGTESHPPEKKKKDYSNNLELQVRQYDVEE